MPSQETSNEIDTNSISIGSRILSEDDFGTVRYVGAVPPTSGLWLGIEWDRADRGKHDGSHQGTRYFDCKSPTSGSFIRLHKADFGGDFSSALTDRYVPDNLETGDVDNSVMYVKDDNNKVTVVEMVGASMISKKQSSSENLNEVDLRDTRISKAGSEDLLKKLPNIRELNLSRNLIASWEGVAEITQQMPKLKLVNLSENRLTLPAEPKQLMGVFLNLQELILNNMAMSWDQIITCAPMWPQLKKLFLCYNKITEIHRFPPDLFQNLELLNLDSNEIADWQQINTALGTLPKLQSLLLGYNPLSSVAFPDTPAQHKTTLFSQLEMLSISHCKVDQWMSINELDKLQKLTDLRYKSNPLVQGMITERAEEMVVAKLGRITHINRCQVLLDDRKGSEIIYLKNFCTEWLKSGGNREPAKSKPNEEFTMNHPRYERLVQLYGAAEDSELTKQSSSLKDSLVSVTIKCPDDSSKRVLTKKLPGGMEITKVKSLLHKIYKVDVSDQKLSYISQKAGQEIQLENDLRQINFYSIENGDVILVRW